MSSFRSHTLLFAVTFSSYVEGWVSLLDLHQKRDHAGPWARRTVWSYAWVRWSLPKHVAKDRDWRPTMSITTAAWVDTIEEACWGLVAVLCSIRRRRGTKTMSPLISMGTNGSGGATCSASSVTKTIPRRSFITTSNKTEGDDRGTRRTTTKDTKGSVVSLSSCYGVTIPYVRTIAERDTLSFTWKPEIGVDTTTNLHRVW